MANIWFTGKFPLAEANAKNAGVMVGHVGIELLEFGDDWLKGRMPVDVRTFQPFGVLHGGASVVLAETLASWGGLATVDPTKFYCVGMEINANHIRPATEGFVYGVATAESIGRTTQVWTTRITNEEGKLVCISRMTLAVVPRPQPPAVVYAE